MNTIWQTKSGEQDKIRLLLKKILKDVLKAKENGHRWKIGCSRNRTMKMIHVELLRCTPETNITCVKYTQIFKKNLSCFIKPDMESRYAHCY